MTPDYNLIYENYKSSKNRTIHPFIRELYDQHLLESIKKVDSDHILATLAFTWTEYNQLYKTVTYDKTDKIAKVSPVKLTDTNHFMVYGHLLINNSSLLIEDSAIYASVSIISDKYFCISKPIFIKPNYKIKIYNFFPTRNKFTKDINFHFNHLIFCTSSRYDVLRLIKKDPEKYVNIHLPDNQNTVEEKEFFKILGIDSAFATTHHYIEEMHTALFNSQSTNIVFI